MNSHRTAALAFVCTLLLGCQNGADSRPQGHVGTAADRDALRQAGVEWDRLFNRGDAAKLASLYAEDAVSMPPNSPTVKGRKAIQAEFETFFAANTARHETTVDEVFVDGNLAVEVARYRMTFKPRTGGGAEVAETGRHVEIRRKIGGAWRIVQEIWNADTPAPASSPP